MAESGIIVIHFFITNNIILAMKTKKISMSHNARYATTPVPHSLVDTSSPLQAFFWRSDTSRGFLTLFVNQGLYFFRLSFCDSISDMNSLAYSSQTNALSALLDLARSHKWHIEEMDFSESDL